jgi:hypothetical protein
MGNLCTGSRKSPPASNTAIPDSANLYTISGFLKVLLSPVRAAYIAQGNALGINP